MSVFISYNHADQEFVDRLCLRLLNENVKVWRDEYKLSAGDSLTARIKAAIEQASVLCVGISEDALSSSWVQREIEAGLLRQEHDSGFVIVPLLLSDARIPEALQDRLWIDFRRDHEAGIARLLELVRAREGVDRSSGTTEDARYFQYFAFEEGWIDGRYDLDLTSVSFDREERFCVLTRVNFRGGETATEETRRQRGITSYKELVLRACANSFEASPARVSITGQRPARGTFFIEADDAGIRFDVRTEVKMLGSHRGETVVFNVGALFAQICAASGIDLQVL